MNAYRRFDKDLQIFDIVFRKGVCTAIPLVGIVTNIINIIVFYKQGLKDGMLIGLLAIAVIDLAKCLEAFACRLPMLFMDFFHGPETTWNFGLIARYVEINLNLLLSTLGAVITTVVTIERCICVALPLKVKLIVNPKVMVSILSTTCVIVCGSLFYIACSYEFTSTKSPVTNSTIVIIRPTALFPHLVKYINVINLFWAVGTITIMVVCTGIMIVRLRASWRFRHRRSATATIESQTSGTPQPSKRDMQLIKVLILINIIHLISIAPGAATRIAREVLPEFTPGADKYFIPGQILEEIAVAMGYANSSVNLFVYMKVSSRFRAVLNNMFARDGKSISSLEVKGLK